MRFACVPGRQELEHNALNQSDEKASEKSARQFTPKRQRPHCGNEARDTVVPPPKINRLIRASFSRLNSMPM